MPQLPTREDFIDIGDLDQVAAFDDFGGKTLEEVRAACGENALGVCEALMWMGRVAFSYYLQAALDYVASAEALEDSTMISGLLATLDFRADPDRELIATPRVRQTIDYIVENYDCFDVTPEIYGDLRANYLELKQRLFAEPTGGQH
jgi:hypothetical protein